MKGDKGYGDAGADGGGRGSPYPLPGQGWSEDDPVSTPYLPDTPPPVPDTPPPMPGMPPPIPGMPPSPGVPDAEDAGRSPHDVHTVGGRSVRAGKLQLWLMFLGPFAVAMLVIFSWAGHQVYVLGDGIETSAQPSYSPEPEPEPVSTVPPKVKGWKAVSSAKYGMTYDVPRSWRILPSGTLFGFETAKGGRPTMMSSVAVFREDSCKDGDDEYSRANTGFNQYVEGGLTAVARHAAKKWATNAYTPEGGPAPSITVGAPETVRVGRDKAVHVRADVAVGSPGRCDPPTGVVHTIAVPGVGPGKTTVFVLVSDQGVPDAAPKAAIKKILGSLRPG